MEIRLAKIDDFKDIWKLEKETFTDDIAFDYEKLLLFFKKNKNMFHVIVDDNNKVCAFTLISPIKESAMSKFENGYVLDLAEIDIDEFISDKEEEENIKNNIKMYYYFGDIVSNREINPTYVLGILKTLMGEVVYNVSVIYSTPVTEEGKKLLGLVGFDKINDNSSDLHSNYKLDVLSLIDSVNNGKVYKRCLTSSYLKRKGRN